MRYLSHGLILPDPMNFGILKVVALTSFFFSPLLSLSSFLFINFLRPLFGALFTCGPRTTAPTATTSPHLWLSQILLQPFTYIQQIPGKQFRSELALAFNHWLLIPAEKLAQIGDIVQMLHNSSLL